ncbi:MAG: hypothetical protein H7240_02985 [Glaciimonas sp.]|nr:hypothetical protein [Glaciimonas sp.]
MLAYLHDGTYPVQPSASVAALMADIQQYQNTFPYPWLIQTPAPSSYFVRFQAILCFITQNMATTDAGGQACKSVGALMARTNFYSPLLNSMDLFGTPSGAGAAVF